MAWFHLGTGLSTHLPIVVAAGAFPAKCQLSKDSDPDLAAFPRQALLALWSQAAWVRQVLVRLQIDFRTGSDLASIVAAAAGHHCHRAPPPCRPSY